MKYIGFIITVLIVGFLFFYKGRIDLKVIKNTGIAFVLSVPIYILSLLFCKYILNITPDKGITIAIYSSFAVICMLIIMVYVSGILVQRLIDFQISLGNDGKGFIKTIVENKNKIIGTVQTFFLLAGLLGFYGIWIKMK